MPGRVIKKSNDAEMRPDWTLIGYSDCPQTTLDGHAYAKNIVDTWDATIANRSNAYYEDRQLMYFPKNIDTSGITNIQDMFENSNIEDLYLNVPNATGNKLCNNCFNLRNAEIILNYNITDISYMFQNCYALESVELKDDTNPWSPSNDILSNQHITNIDYLFNNCHSLKHFQGGTSSSDDPTTIITSANNAFYYCDKLEELILGLPCCNNLGMAYAGKNALNGCRFEIYMGIVSTGPNLTFRCDHTKIASESHFDVERCTNMAESFRNSEIDMEDSMLILKGTLSNMYTGFSCERLFYGCNFPNGTSEIDITSVSNAQQMFGNCIFGNNICDMSDIKFGSDLQNYYKMFENCPTLHTITGLQWPLYGTNFTDMFISTPNLDDATINSLLDFFAHANAYAGTKTLYEVGFRSSDYTAARIQALSNYSDFIAAGWTIGY